MINEAITSIWLFLLLQPHTRRLPRRGASHVDKSALDDAYLRNDESSSAVVPKLE